MKISIIKKGEYDIWSMRMRQYICHTNHNLWDIIVNGDFQEEPALTGDQYVPSAPLVPKIAKQLAAKRNQERVKSILLLAIPDEYLLKFHNVPDAKSLWEAIKSSLDKAYDRLQKLISQLEVYIALVSKEDINKKFLRSLPPSWSQIALIIKQSYSKRVPREPGDQSGSSAPPVPKTVKQLAAKRNQERVKSILLLAIPDEYLLKFHNVPDAKSLWEVIKSRFGGNEESKKMQKNVLKHQFENFTTAPNEILDKGYDRFQKLISQLEVYAAPVSKKDINQKFLRSLPPSWSQIALIKRNKPDIEQTDIDDLYNNLRVYENEMKRSSSSTSNSHNLAFLSSENTSRTNEVSIASGNFRVNNAGGTNSSSQITSPPLDNEDLQQIDQDDLEELDIRWQLSATTITGKGTLLRNANQDGTKGKDLMVIMAGRMQLQMNHHNNHCQMNAHDKNGLEYGTQLNEMSDKSETDNEISMSVFEVRSSDEESTPANDRFSKADGYHVVPLPITRNFLTLRADISFAGLDEYAIRKKIIESKTTELNADTSKSKTSETVGNTNEVNVEKPKSVNESVVSTPNINKDKVIIEDWNSDDENDVSEVSPVKTNETQTAKTQVDKIGQTSKKAGIGFKKIKACFVCKSTDHLIKDYDFYDKKSLEPKLKNVVNTGQRVVKPVWDNAKRVNHQKISNKLNYPQARRTFVPSGVLTRTGLVKPIRPNEKRAVQTINTARPVSTARSISTARPFAPKTAQTSSAVRLIYPRIDNGNPEICLQDHAVVDSGCSSHMTSNKAYLLDYEDYNRGFMAFRSDPKGGKITGKGKIRTANLDFDDVYFVDELTFNLFSVTQMCDKKNNVLFTNTECLILSPSFKLLDENQVILRAHRQNGVYSLDLKNIVPSGGLENQLNHKVKISRGEMGEFKNHAMNEFYAKKGIKREFSVARTPQQNGVAERKNRTLIEMTEDEQVLHDELEKMIAQEMAAQAVDDATRQAFEEEKRKNASTKRAAQATSINKLNTGRPSVNTANTPYVSAASTPTGVNAGESSFVYLGGQIPIDASTLPNADLPTDPNMPDLKDVSNAFPNDGIFSGAFDDDDVGAKADFNNMDNTIDVSPIPTLRVHKDHPKGQILGDPKSAVQTRGKIQKASSVQHALDGRYRVYDDVSAPVASAFLIGTIEEVVYVLNSKLLLLLSSKQSLLRWIKALLWAVIKPSRAGLKTVMHKRLQMSSMVNLHSFETSSEAITDGIFISQASLWYPRDSPFELEAFSDSDYGGASLDRKSKIEYVTSANCCGQVLWIQNQMMDYDCNFMNTRIHIDNESTINVIKNPECII
ncbi:ribonuclease H-like domain-containing protein [Tanacetum coccineum]